jgi:hypothetical protein
VFVGGGDQGKEFVLPLHFSKGELESSSMVHPSESVIFLPAFGHTCGPHDCVQDCLTAPALCVCVCGGGGVRGT